MKSHTVERAGTVPARSRRSIARWSSVITLGLCVFALVSACGQTSPEPSEPVADASQPLEVCRHLELTAAKTYGPVAYEDASVYPDPPISVVVPTEIPVTVGNGGNQTLTLKFRRGTGEWLCKYKARASVQHPTTPRTSRRAVATRGRAASGA
jgi:hypothetical protein